MAGRRKGEARRVNHDIFAGIRKWKHLDQARIRELFESPTLRLFAHTFVEEIKILAPNIEQGALEALAHGLIRESLKQPTSLEVD